MQRLDVVGERMESAPVGDIHPETPEIGTLKFARDALS